MQVGKYHLYNVIGDGSFSKVRLGVQVFTNETVAVKIIEKSSITDQSQLDSLQERISILQNFDHPGIVKLIEVLEDETTFYCVFEYCGGGELFDFIIARQRVEEPLAKRFFKQIVLAVGYCHSQNVVHRDLKPENMLLADNNTVKLIDFGLCNNQADQPLTDRCGSSCYIAPEALTSTSYYGIPADIWALGVILYALVDGSLPWNYQNPDHMFQQITTGTFPMPQSISPQCQDLLRGILNPDVSQRFSIDVILTHPWLFGIGNVFPIKKPPMLPNLEPHLNLSLGGFSATDIRPGFDLFPQSSNPCTLQTIPEEEPNQDNPPSMSELPDFNQPRQEEPHLGLNFGQLQLNPNTSMTSPFGNMNSPFGNQFPSISPFANSPMNFEPPSGFGQQIRSARSKPVQPRSISLDSGTMTIPNDDESGTNTYHGPIMSQTISHKEPHVVAQQFENTLQQHGIKYRKIGPLMFHLSGNKLQITAEVCKLHGFRNIYVIAFKRIQGESWDYTQFVSQILSVFKAD